MVETKAPTVAVAVAPEPAPPEIVTDGADVYPLPGVPNVSAVTGPKAFMRVQPADALKPAVLTAKSTSLFWTGSISLNSSGTSPLYCTAGTAGGPATAGYA